MNAYQFGAALRAVRLRRAWTQQQLADAARVSRWAVSMIERGHLGKLHVEVVERICVALDAHLEIGLRWRGAELDRLMNRDHAAMHEWAAAHLTGVGGWLFAAEVSFSVFGERGVIDLLAFHPASGTLLVIELKTAIVDPQRLVGDMDRRRRLAVDLARSRGWAPQRVAVWVVLAESRTNRRKLARASRLLRGAFPMDGRALRGWLAHPSSPVAALSFMPSAATTSTGPLLAGRRRVSKRCRPARRARVARVTAELHAERVAE